MVGRRVLTPPKRKNKGYERFKKRVYWRGGGDCRSACIREETFGQKGVYAYGACPRRCFGCGLRRGERLSRTARGAYGLRVGSGGRHIDGRAAFRAAAGFHPRKQHGADDRERRRIACRRGDIHAAGAVSLGGGASGGICGSGTAFRHAHRARRRHSRRAADGAAPAAARRRGQDAEIPGGLCVRGCAASR